MSNGIQDVESLCIDSKKVSKNAHFFVRKKTKMEYIQEAIDKGAKCLVTEKKLPFDIEQIIVKDIEKEIAQVASAYYNHPSKSLFLIGITGTCGKTTTSYLIEHIFNHLHFPLGLMGSIEKKSTLCTPSGLTTPDAIQINQFLSQALNDHKRGVVMEVSSHALDQKRVYGLDFDSALFTNFSHEHLDYHESLEHYFNAKALLFLMPVKHAILNADDPYIISLVPKIKCEIITFGMEQKATLFAKNIQTSLNGTQFELVFGDCSFQIKTPLIGKINVYNILAAAATALGAGLSIEQIAYAIPSFEKVRGRLEKIGNVFIDHAHKPDALEKVLVLLKEHTQGRLICVFGCGGQRDCAKRPLMGKIASLYADLVVITSDNPRNEDPRDICMAIAQGCTTKNYLIEIDRKKAIHFALEKAHPEDTILIAGKGHETYQTIKGQRLLFEDQQIVKTYLNYG